VTFLLEYDEANRSAVEKARARWQAAGRETWSLRFSSPTIALKDVNDVLVACNSQERCAAGSSSR
jgi:hypothetical protein